MAIGEPPSIEHQNVNSELEQRRSKIERMIDISHQIDQADREKIPQTDLQTIDVKEIIKDHGPISVKDWMFCVLYGKDGYYSSGRAKINSGDFSTAVSYLPDVSAFVKDVFSNLQTNTDSPIIVSVASGGGDFDRNVQAVIREDLPDKKPKIIALDYSLELLKKQKEKTANINDEKFYIKFGFLGTEMITIQNYDEEGDSLIALSTLRTLFQGIDLDSNGETVTNNQGKATQFLSEKQIEIINKRANKILGTARLLPEDWERLRRWFINDPNNVFYLENIIKLSNPTIQNGTRISGSAAEIPLKSESVDAVFSNELHDAFPSRGFKLDDSKIRELQIGLDADENFAPVYQELTDSPTDLLKRELVSYRQEQIRDTQAGEPISDFITWNPGTVEFLKESTRVLKTGGVSVHADYVQRSGPNYQGTGYDDDFRFQYLGHWRNFVRLDIDKYQEPYMDVTVNMDPNFIKWLAQGLDLEVVTDEQHEDFVSSRATRTGVRQTAGPLFYVLVLRKK